MKCRHVIPDLVDFARDLPLAPSRQQALTEHLRSCASCAARVETERAMSAALRTLAADQASAVPPASAMQLGKLLGTFETPRRRRHRVKIALEWALAASVLIVAGLAAAWKSAPPAVVSDRTAAAPVPPMNAESAFVVLPGADALPRFEHGQLVQIDIPSAAGTVRAEVLIGQDGLARAARLVQ
jgi:anti-sigma factor RsiW